MQQKNPPKMVKDRNLPTMWVMVVQHHGGNLLNLDEEEDCDCRLN
jgi:hypothetical protein